MSETKHSPEPWTFQDDTTFSTLGDKRLVAANRISPGIVFGGLGAETDANAHLMVAAPDLLNALKRFMGYYETDFFRLGAEDGRTLSEWVRTANAAIAKAEGQ